MKSFAFLATVLAVLAFGKPATALNVVTTTTDLAAIARAVGGEHVDVTSLTRGTRDPHYAEAKPSMIRSVFRADVLLLVGAELEIGWLPAALQAGRNAKVLPGGPGYLDLSETVPLLDVQTGAITRAMGDVHAAGNPHYWLDPLRGISMAKAVAARFARLDPAHASEYEMASKAFESAVIERMKTWRAALAPLKGKKVLQYHKSFVYLGEAFRMTLAGEVEPLPGIAPSARHLQRLIARIKAEKIGVLIMEPYYDRRGAEFLRDKTGITVVVLPHSVGASPEIKTYFDLFDGIVAAFRKAKVI
ncbi:MAG: metal ABC transporter substrate-binding protein [Rhodospirillales bacterium]